MRRTRTWLARTGVSLLPPVAALATALATASAAQPSARAAPVGAAPSAPLASLDKVMEAADRALSSRRHRYGQPLAVGSHGRGQERSLAPYFVKPGSREPGIEALPLRSTSAEVTITGVIARVRLTQVYQNRGAVPIEAIYVFPASTRAAVHGMRMRIGRRVVEARIARRTVARRRYERARRQGRRAALLAQQRANVFTMRVANILPGDQITVSLDYSELLVPEAHTYELVVPTVVGPRYAGEAPRRRDGWVRSPYRRKGRGPSYTFSAKVHVTAPMPLQAISSPSHQVSVRSPAPTRAEITLPAGVGGDRDFVLRYRLAGKQIQSGVLTYRAGGEQFFLAMVEPPARTDPALIPRRELIFVLDVSGSMSGFPLTTAKGLLRSLLRALRPSDYFNVVLFAGGSALLSQRSLPAGPEQLARALQVIDHQRGGGGTQLLGALRTAYAIPPVREGGVSRQVVVLTDGYVTVESQSFRFIRKHLHRASCHAFGIGSSVNRALIEGMARAGLGVPFVARNAQEARSVAARFQRYVSSPLLTGVRVAISGARAYDVIPESPPDLLAERPLVIFGKYRGTGRITLSGRTGRGGFERSFALPAASRDPITAPLRVLWARRWVTDLMDQLAVLRRSPPIEGAITQLGLRYNLLTRFTSFVAVDRVIANRTGHGVQAHQPLPLPQGVPNTAVGGAPPPPGAVRITSAVPCEPEAQRGRAGAVRAVQKKVGGCQCDSGQSRGADPAVPLALLLAGGWLLGWRRRRARSRT